MPRAVLFDIDDTLHDWWASFRLAVEAMRPLLAPDQRATAEERLREVMVAEAYERTGEPYENRVHWRMFVEPEPILAMAFPGVDPSRLVEAFRRAGPPVRFDDVEPCLAALRDAYALGVLSNNPFAERSLEALGVRHAFDAVVGLDDDAVRKPNPVAFEMGCDAMGVSASEAVYVGDSPGKDVEGALAAGLTPIWLDRLDDPFDPPAAALRISSLAELPALLDSLPR